MDIPSKSFDVQVEWFKRPMHPFQNSLEDAYFCLSVDARTKILNARKYSIFRREIAPEFWKI